MGLVDDEGEVMPTGESLEIAHQKTIRLLILCVAILLGWGMWCMNGCMHDENELFKLREQIKHHQAGDGREGRP